jgi:tRNA(Arg) A34 adenosine deaminase TadA
MPDYTSEEVAWAALALSLFVLLLFTLYVVISNCDLCASRRHHRVIRHIIVTPPMSQSGTSIKA